VRNRSQSHIDTRVRVPNLYELVPIELLSQTRAVFVHRGDSKIMVIDKMVNFYMGKILGNLSLHI